MSKPSGNPASTPYRSDLKWPIPLNVEDIIGDWFEQLLSGYLLKFSKIIRRPVVFHYLDPEGQFKYIENLSDVRDFSPVCSAFREDPSWLKQCHMNDNTFAQISRECHGKDKDNKQRIIIDNSGKMRLEIYKCKRLGFTEWMVPVVLRDKWLGTFITGQFVEDPDESKQLIKTQSLTTCLFYFIL